MEKHVPDSANELPAFFKIKARLASDSCETMSKLVFIDDVGVVADEGAS